MTFLLGWQILGSAVQLAPALPEMLIIGGGNISVLS